MTKGGLFSYLRAYLTHITPYKLFIRLFFVIYIGSFDTPSTDGRIQNPFNPFNPWLILHTPKPV